MQDVTINGARLKVEVIGAENKNAPVIIAHHGAPGIGSSVEPRRTFGPFADEYRVVVFDARGSGKSQDLSPFTHEQWVADVDAIREWVGAEKFIMAGGSYGGFIALEYALRHPDRVNALVLRDTFPDNTHRKFARVNAEASTRIKIDPDLFDRIMSGTLRDNADFKAAFAHTLPLYDFKLDPDKIAARVEAVNYHYETHNYAFAVAQKDYDLKDRLHTISVPTLITVGRHDWITPVSGSETLNQLIPNSELVVFEESGHAPNVEQAPLFRATVRDFLQRALAGRIHP